MAFNTNTTGQAARVAAATTVTGSAVSPVVVTQAGGITPGGYNSEFMYVRSSSGIYLLSANPQIAPGTVIGQTLTLIGTSDTNYFAFAEGNGLFAGNAALGTGLQNNFIITFTWIGTVWANLINIAPVDTAP